MYQEGKKLFDVEEATAYCERRIGRDFLYELAHTGAVPVLWVGKGKLLFPRASLDRVLAGELLTAGKGREAGGSSTVGRRPVFRASPRTPRRVGVRASRSVSAGSEK